MTKHLTAETLTTYINKRLTLSWSQSHHSDFRLAVRDVAYHPSCISASLHHISVLLSPYRDTFSWTRASWSMASAVLMWVQKPSGCIICGLVNYKILQKTFCTFCNILVVLLTVFPRISICACRYKRSSFPHCLFFIIDRITQCILPVNLTLLYISHADTPLVQH